MRRVGFALLLAVTCWVGRAAGEIVVGNLVDLTGETASVGKPYADGIKAYTQWLNERGGIGGEPVRLVQIDYRYRIAAALEAYKELKDKHKVVAIQGWGTGDTEALTEQVGKDSIPYWSASYSAHLTDPKKAPFNFIVTADYSTQLRAGLKYLRDTWQLERRPKLAFLYPNHPYGKAPLAAGRQYATQLGFEIVGEEVVDLTAIEATTQLLNLKKDEPDFAWLGGTTPSCAVVLMDARKLGFKTRFLVNIWGNDANLVTLAGNASDGVLGLQGTVTFGAAVPGMAEIIEATGGQPRSTHFIRGWVSMLTMCEAIKRAQAAGDLTGAGIKRAAETLRDFDTGGLTAPITYTPADHRPSMSAVIVEYRDGAMATRETVVLERKAEWLGF